MVRRMVVINEEKFHPSGSEQNPSSTTRVEEKQGEACFYVQPAEVFLKSWLVARLKILLMGVLLLAKTGLEGMVDTPLPPQLETILLPVVWKYGFLTAPKVNG